MKLLTMEFTIPVVSLVFTTMLLIVYFSKSNINSQENKIFKVMLIATFAECLFDSAVHLFCSVNTFDVITKPEYYLTISLINKLVVICFSIIFEGLFLYILTITYDKKVVKSKKNIIFLAIINIIVFIALQFTSIKIVNEGTASNVIGSTPMLGYMIICLFLTLSLFITLRNYSKIDNRYLPTVLICAIMVVCYLLAVALPGLILYDFAITILCYLMFFTIENPDIKLAKELTDAKLISDNANEEKALFLYNMTQEIRATTKNIDIYSENILHSTSLEEDKDDARNIKGEIAKFRTMTNDILDISTIDISNIKIYNSKYDLKLLLKTVVGKYYEICNNKNIDLRINIEHDIPDRLYGDSISLKKVINLILTYACKNTERGYIEFNVNTIIKNDICRLIITVEDSSNGIPASDLEKIKLEDKMINEAYKLITLMNGTMVITSSYGVGNKIKNILDQKIVKDKDALKEKYYKIYNNNKILVIDDSLSSLKIIEKLLKDSGITAEFVTTGKEAYNKIKVKNKYDLILVDEKLNQISGEELLKNLKNIRNFNIPVVLMSKDNQYEYNEKYKKSGFSGILTKPLKKDKILDIIEKYIGNKENN